VSQGLQIQGFSVKCIASDARVCSSLDGLTLEHRPIFEGDVVLVEVTSHSGEYREVENFEGRSEQLYYGDLFVAVIGNRDSAKYFSSYVPAGGFSIDNQDRLELLSNGGIIGRSDNTPGYLASPMTVRCVGALSSASGPINVLPRDAAPLPAEFPPIILVSASTTDAGKTTLTANLINALTRRHGLAVASCKLAGTGCLEDILAHKDAGAKWFRDFPDAGLPSTYTSPENYVPGVRKVLGELASYQPDVIVAELGGDLIWANIPVLLQLEDVMRHVVKLVVIPSDVMSAVGTLHLLSEWGVTTPVSWCIPPNRNPEAVGRRMRAYVSEEFVNLRSREDTEALAGTIAQGASAHV
jgi:hypothetical protein